MGGGLGEDAESRAGVLGDGFVRGDEREVFGDSLGDEGAVVWSDVAR